MSSDVNNGVNFSFQVIGAVRALRESALYDADVPEYVREAIKVVDDADLFAEIDAACNGLADARRRSITDTTTKERYVFEVELSYKIVKGSVVRGPMIKLFEQIHADDEEQALLVAQAKLREVLARAKMIENDDQLVILSGVTAPVD